jgi:hypothetical protein
MVGPSNIQNLGLEVGVFAEVNSVLLADVVTVIYQFLVEIVQLVFSCDHSNAGLRSENLFCLDLQRERSRLPFVKETVVKELPSFSLEDQRV